MSYLQLCYASYHRRRIFVNMMFVDCLCAAAGPKAEQNQGDAAEAGDKGQSKTRWATVFTWMIVLIASLVYRVVDERRVAARETPVSFCVCVLCTSCKLECLTVLRSSCSVHGRRIHQALTASSSKHPCLCMPVSNERFALWCFRYSGYI